MKRNSFFSAWRSLLAIAAVLPATMLAQPTAKEWNAQVVGWNLGNQLECSAPGQDGETMAIGNPVVTKKVIKAVKEAGFNAIRIPIRWQCHITNPTAMSIDKAWLARVKEIVNWCLSNDLKVIINTHHDKWLEGRPTNQYKDENNQKNPRLRIWLCRTRITRHLLTSYVLRVVTMPSVTSSSRLMCATPTLASTMAISSFLPM